MTTPAPANAAGGPWFRSPRNLIVLALALVAVIVGVFVVVNRDSDRSGSATAKVGSGPNKTLADYFAASNITQTPIRPGDRKKLEAKARLPYAYSAFLQRYGGAERRARSRGRWSSRGTGTAIRRA